MIPKKIHYCWLSGEEIPKILQDYMATWRKFLPEYEFVLWDKDKFDINSIKWVKEAYAEKKYAFAADYIRFYALYNYGGIYLDTDVEVLKTFNPLLQSKSFMGFEHISIPEAAVIGTEAGVCWIKKCFEYYTDKSFYDTKGKIRDLAVPIMMKAVLRKHYMQNITDTSQIQHVDELDLYPYKYFYPRDPYRNRIDLSDDTYCIHHSVGSWCGGERKKANRYKHLLLSGVLGKRRYDELLYRHHVKKIINEIEN
jgi:mannosyltransferase OCH1-like enzyme